MRQIFVSHAHEDAAVVARLVTAVHAARGDVTVHASSHRPSGAGWRQWPNWIRRTLAASDLVIFVASPASLGSPWCSAELGLAWSRRLPVLSMYVGHEVLTHPLASDANSLPLDDQSLAELPVVLEEILGSRAGSTLAPLTPPYPGLAPLGAKQAAVLFGRSEERARIVAAFDPQVPQAQVVVVSGPSGAGKSSVVLAGVVPALEEAGWRVDGPYHPRQLASLDLAAVLPPVDPAGDPRRLLVLDQSEELATLADGDRVRVREWVSRLPGNGWWVLAVVRTEFRDLLPDWPEPTIDHHLPFLGVKALEQVVRGPARVAALDIEESLVDRLVRETGSGSALPLLAFTLEKLWADRDVAANALREATLDALGGVAGVITRQADLALHAGSGGRPDRAERILAMLSRLASPTQIPPTRTPRRVTDLSAQERDWAGRFVAVGLLTYRTGQALGDQGSDGMVPTGDDLLDVTHESLFDWAPLASAITLRREENILLERIDRAALQWEESQRRDDDLLLTGDRLRRALTLQPSTEERPETGSTVVTAFLRASRRHDRERRVVRLLTATVTVLAVVALVAAVTAGFQWRSASDARDLAQQAEIRARSVQVAAEATGAIGTDRDFALLAAAKAWQIQRNDDTESALRDVLSAPGGPVRWFHQPGPRWQTMQALAPGLGVVIGEDLTPTVVDLDSGSLTTRPVALADGRRLQVDQLRPAPDGPWALVAGQPVTGAEAAVGWVDISGQHASRLVGYEQPVTALGGTGNLLLLGDTTGAVAVLTRDAAAPQVVDRHGSRVTDVGLSADGRWLASASTSGIRILHREAAGAWRLAGQAGRRTGETRAAEQLAFSGRDAAVQLFASGSDPTIRRWTLDGAVTELEPIAENSSVVLDMAVDEAAGTLYSVGRDGGLSRWSTTRLAQIGVTLRQHALPIRSVSARGDGQVVTGAGPDSGEDQPEAAVWDLRPERTVERAGFLPDVWRGESFAAVVEGDGPLAAITTDGHLLAEDGRRWDVPRPTRRAWWMADGSLLVETSGEPQLDLGPYALWRVTGTGFTQIDRPIQSLAVDRCQAAVADGARVDFLDEGGCGAVPDPIELPAGTVNDMTLSDDGTLLAMVVDPDTNSGERLELRSVADGRLIGARDLSDVLITGIAMAGPRRVALGRDIGGTNVVLDLEGRDADRSFGSTHTDAVWLLAQDPDTGRLYAGGQDGLITTTANDGRPIGEPWIGVRSRQLNDPAAEVRSMTLRADDRVLLAVHGDRLVAWELEPDRLAAQACAAADRLLRAEEQERLGVDGTPCSP